MTQIGAQVQGHSSTRAAQVYLHAREELGQQIAATLDKMARRQLSRARKRRREDQAVDETSGTQAQEGLLRATGAGPVKEALSWALAIWSRRRESNSHYQLGKPSGYGCQRR